MRIVGYLILVVFVSACDQSKIDKAAQNTSQIAVPGWIIVLSGIDKQQVASQKGLFAQTYDEFVGGLIDAGLNISMSTWIKPTYGNQNLLWITDGQIGQKQQSVLMKSSSDFNPAIYAFRKGVIALNNAKWKYVGYSDKSDGEGSKAFNSYIFVCDDRGKGVSVFYWGDGIASLPDETESVKTLLNKLASRCKTE